MWGRATHLVHGLRRRIRAVAGAEPALKVVVVPVVGVIMPHTGNHLALHATKAPLVAAVTLEVLPPQLDKVVISVAPNAARTADASVLARLLEAR